MSRFMSLLKVQTRGIFPFNKLFHSSTMRDKIKYILIFIFIITGIVGLEIALYWQSQLLGMAFNTTDQIHFLPGILYFAYIFFSLFMTLLQGGSTLFSTKDWDLLGSLPLKKSEILGSNIAVLYIIEFFISLLFFLPVTLVFLQFRPLNLNYLTLILHLIVAPILPLAIGGLVSTLFSLVTSRLPFRKAISTVFGLLLLPLTLYITAGIPDSTGQFNPAGSPLEASGVLGQIFRFSMYYAKGFYSGVLSNVGVILAVSGLACGMFLFLYINLHETIVMRLNSATTKKKYSLSSSGSSQFFALLKKDIRMTLSNTGYVVNAVSGGITILFISILILGNLPEFQYAFDFLPIRKGVSYVLVMLLFTVMGNVGSPSTTIISAEGITFPLLKSLPIPSLTVLKSKLALSILYVYPFVAISAIYIGIKLKVGFQFLLLGLVSTLLLVYIFSLVGIFCNLLLPKLQWKSIAHLIKRNLALFLSLIFNIFFVGLVGGAGYFLCQNNLSLILPYIFTSLVLFAIFFTFLLFTFGPKVLEKITP